MADPVPYVPLRPRPRIPLKQRVIASVIFALISAAFGWWGVSMIAKSNPFAEYVEPGRADTVAEQFAQSGPVFLRDLAGRKNDLYVLHEGIDHNQGWTAVGVFVPETENCIVQWNDLSKLFEAQPLDESQPAINCIDRVFPSSGEGLKQYPIWSDENHLKIDVNFAEREQ